MYLRQYAYCRSGLSTARISGRECRHVALCSLFRYSFRKISYEKDLEKATPAYTATPGQIGGTFPKWPCDQSLKV